MFRHRGKVILLASACLAVALIVVLMAATASSIVASDWRSDWAVRRGFEVLIDAQGFQFPTSIAFVRSPGNLPKDPIYFVTELKGAVKVVTNDRTVFTFAEGFFSRKPKRAVPAIDDEVGLAGICLDDENGYVFVTFAYHDDDNIQRNNVVRFQSKPDTFTLAPLSQVEFTEMFAPYPSTPSHQIGGCQVRGEHLYVNVADAGGIAQSQQIDSLLGKVLRMTLDGLPANDNPFYQDDDIGKAANYVWAYGFRNPVRSEIGWGPGLRRR